MHTRMVEAFLGYTLAEDKSQAATTFSFPHLSADNYVTINHDTGENAAESYWLSMGATSLALNVKSHDGITINIWHDTDIIAGGIYQVDTYGGDYILRNICSSGIDLIQGDTSADPHYMSAHNNNYVLHNISDTSIEFVRGGKMPSGEKEELPEEDRFAVD